jgi:predicted RNA-binding Zn ribbon-like protein
MKLVGGDPCLDFVNTVGERLPDRTRLGTQVQDDKLAGYADLVAFGVHRGLLEPGVARELLRRGRARPAAARSTLGRARALREALHRTLRALMGHGLPLPRDLVRINAEVRACRAREGLIAQGQGLAWAWRGAGPALAAPLWPVVRAAAALLTSDALARLRECGGEGCGWLFLDRSRTRKRRWCSMDDCGNREKLRRFRARQARRAAGVRARDAVVPRRA